MAQVNYTTYGGEYTYTLPLYNSTTTETSMSSIIQELMDKINLLEVELLMLKAMMKQEIIEEIKNNIGTW